LHILLSWVISDSTHIKHECIDSDDIEQLGICPDAIESMNIAPYWADLNEIWDSISEIIDKLI